MGIDAETIPEELIAPLESNNQSYRTAARWTNRFREKREDVNDDPRFRRPVSELADENIELVRQIINNDPHSTFDEIIGETSLSLSHGTIERVICDCLKMKKMTSR